MPEFRYYVLWQSPPKSGELERLCTLLGDARTDNGAAGAEMQRDELLVLPRTGTISAWSSKAGEIARNCGLPAVLRIERGTAWPWEAGRALPAALLHDRMTEQLVFDSAQAESIVFAPVESAKLRRIDVCTQGKAALAQVNDELHLGLSEQELELLLQCFQNLERNPSDAELMMFAQFHSEHCRHKIFNAAWTIDGQTQEHSPFELIRQTSAGSGAKLLSAYQDNAAVFRAYPARAWQVRRDGEYAGCSAPAHLVIKAETHNHPTAICPFMGAATGSGGEIRDEAATGRGGRPLAGLIGFSVSNLHIPGWTRPWEQSRSHSPWLATPLQIMLEGPVGAAAYNNEFGRPTLCGFFRTYEQPSADGERLLGYDKPILLAGGIGTILEQHVGKCSLSVGDLLLVLGGPAMRIGLGGASASSMKAGSATRELDYASVQRGNAEMQRRCQEVIEACRALEQDNPILSLHDVGAGGLANAVPELLQGHGAVLDLQAIPSADMGMSPLEYWCNEAQERYVLILAPVALEAFTQLCARERAPCAVIGRIETGDRLRLQDGREAQPPVDLPLPELFGKIPATVRQVQRRRPGSAARDNFERAQIDLQEATRRVLQLPAVADKSFLITIGDRSVRGLTVRDQMVGPWQVPVADCAVIASSFQDNTGSALALGERPAVAALDAPASGRLAVAEALLNLCAARILDLRDVCLSANWMAACAEPGMDADLYDTVAAVSKLCRTLGVTIPVGKDSLSMHSEWQEGAHTRRVSAPVSLVISAFAPVADVARSLTPQLRGGDSVLVLADLGAGRNRLGGSALAQVYGRDGGAAPDLDNASDLLELFRTVQLLNETGYLWAYHDRSDGGLWATLCEMAFASRIGIDLELNGGDGDLLGQLFSEEPGVVLQVPRAGVEAVLERLPAGRVIGTPRQQRTLRVLLDGDCLLEEDLLTLQRCWAETSYHMRALRDHPQCAQQEYERLQDWDDPGLQLQKPEQTVPAAALRFRRRPRLAVLREQGVNGQSEMAAAFDRAGFQCIDVHTSDVLEKRVSLRDFQGLAACGGFSYGDVLGAGGGWAGTILHNPHLRAEFSEFFQRPDTFSLGVCNGCQMLARLCELIPGAEHWPRFTRNYCEQFEARLVMVEIQSSPSILLNGMQGWRLPIVVAHGEGRAALPPDHPDAATPVCLRYVDHRGRPTETYPLNPNGSSNGCTGFTSQDGRATIMMPHPERSFLSRQYSWYPGERKETESPWMHLFYNARRWLGQ